MQPSILEMKVSNYISQNKTTNYKYNGETFSNTNNPTWKLSIKNFYCAYWLTL